MYTIEKTKEGVDIGALHCIENFTIFLHSILFTK